MRKYKRKLIGALAALLVLAGVMDATGGSLAQPERTQPEEDAWVGFFLSWEYLPGEGEMKPRSGEGWVEYGSQSMDVEGLGSVSFPREILIGQYSDGEGFTFPGMEGYCAFLAEVEQEDGSILLTGNQLMHASTHVGDAENSVSGTIYYGLPAGETAWPEDGSMYGWTAYNVYQMPDGTVYLDGSGNSYGGAGGMTIETEHTKTETVNGEETSVYMSVEVRFETVSRLQAVKVKQFDASDQVIGEAVLPAGGLEAETPVTLEEETRWLVVEEHGGDGTVTRTVYDAGEIAGEGGLLHGLVILDDRGMGQWKSLWLKRGDAGAAAA